MASVSRLTVWLKGPYQAFSIKDSLFFYLGLTGYACGQAGTLDYSQEESQDSPYTICNKITGTF